MHHYSTRNNYPNGLGPPDPAKGPGVVQTGVPGRWTPPDPVQPRVGGCRPSTVGSRSVSQPQFVLAPCPYCQGRGTLIRRHGEDPCHQCQGGTIMVTVFAWVTQ